MRVYLEDPREVGLRRSQDAGLPHSSDPEKAVKGELWVGVTPSGRSPVIWIPMKGVSRAVKPRVEGLTPNNVKPYETRTPWTWRIYGVWIHPMLCAVLLPTVNGEAFSCNRCEQL